MNTGALPMKKKIPVWSRRHMRLPRTQLGDEPADSAPAARQFGNDAMSAGLDRPDLGRVREHARVVRAASHGFSDSPHALIKRAGSVPTDAGVASGKTHRFAGASFQPFQQRAETPEGTPGAERARPCFPGCSSHSHHE
jgi:hypothetical protein